MFVRSPAKTKILQKNASIQGIKYYGVSMDVRYICDMKIIVNALVYIFVLGINAFETIGVQLVQCVLDKSCMHATILFLVPISGQSQCGYVERTNIG